MKTSNLGARPEIKRFTKAKLRELIKTENLPVWQRWKVEKNVKDLSKSIRESGSLRLPIVEKLMSEKGREILIDGRHLVEAYCLDESISDEQEFECIFKVVLNMTEAARDFRNLNTTGKQLDWVDITHLYMHAHKEKGNVYEIIWNHFFKNPSNLKDVKNVLPRGFSVSTIIEFLVSNKDAYRKGEATESGEFYERRDLLEYLMSNVESVWEKEFPSEKKGIPPNGAAILEFANYWFSSGVYKKHSNEDFLRFANEIFLENQAGLKSRTVAIYRDTAKSLMRKHLKKQVQIA